MLQQGKGGNNMQASAQLKELLHSINRKSYPAYKSLRGAYQFDRYILSIDHVQGDPFASPSHISVKLSHRDTGFPAEYYKDSLTRITLGDFLNRQFEQQVNRYTFRAKGSGKSGLISVSHCGQEVLARTACEITEKGITARFFIGFPANGRTINSPELEKILFDFLPVCIHKAFFYRNLDPEALRKAICLAEDQAFIRQELKKRSLAAFVSDGAILPRESGISSRPMKNSVPFVSPESLRVSMELPHRGTITGMGIPCGITLIVGGGYHGKSTLLNALELGIYDHISGDGRGSMSLPILLLRSFALRTAVLSKMWTFLFLSTIFQIKKTPSAFLQRMPAAVLHRLPVSWKVWRPEVKSFSLTRIPLPPTLWSVIPSCSG